MLDLQAFNGSLESSQSERVGEPGCIVEGGAGTKETSEVKGPPLLVGLAGVLDQLDEFCIERKFPLSDSLCRLLIADPVT